MRNSRVFFLAASALAVIGCDQPRSQLATAPTLAAFTVGVPDASFRLTPEQRASVLPSFDANELERLLSMVPPEARPALLSHFQPPRPGGRSQLLIRLGHPALQAQLEKVWVPYWAEYSDQEIDREVEYLPGRQAAKALRAARKPLPDPR